ncbi:MAG: energy transducer TonB [Deltaproteobacteria bacterium]|nr:energy transducer TonB [Deltaproteobacteria bacterium]
MHITTSSNLSPYSKERATRRDEARKRLEKKVENPVNSELYEDKFRNTSKPLSSIGKALIFSVATLLVHGTVIAAMGFFNPEENGSESYTEKVLFNVNEVEKFVPKPVFDDPEPVVETIAEPEPDQIVKPKAKDFTNKKDVKYNSKKVISADPVANNNEKPQSDKPRRRVIGLSLSSTVDGAGPAFAVGNTRMGKTDRVASDEKVEQLTSEDVNSNRTGVGAKEGSGGGPQVNQVAKSIPTAGKFEKPTRVSDVNLEYPQVLKSKGIEGNVVLLIVIDVYGKVQKVRILKSSGYPEFDKAALSAAEKELFSPAKRDGSPVEYNLKYTYRFRITGA